MASPSGTPCIMCSLNKTYRVSRAEGSLSLGRASTQRPWQPERRALHHMQPAQDLPCYSRKGRPGQGGAHGAHSEPERHALHHVQDHQDGHAAQLVSQALRSDASE